MIDSIRIPDDRKAILIGKSGKTKEKIEKFTKTKVSVKDEITVSGEPENLLKCLDIIKAIGRGFSPERALNILDEKNHLEIIALKGEHKKIKRLSSRVIGRSGSARKNIEMLTGASICVYGKTISIIGKYDDVKFARKAVEMILVGRTHGYVYNKLEKMRGKKTHGKNSSRPIGKRAERG